MQSRLGQKKKKKVGVNNGQPRFRPPPLTTGGARKLPGPKIWVICTQPNVTHISILCLWPQLSSSFFFHLYYPAVFVAIAAKAAQGSQILEGVAIMVTSRHLVPTSLSEQINKVACGNQMPPWVSSPDWNKSDLQIFLFQWLLWSLFKSLRTNIWMKFCYFFNFLIE